MFKEPDELAAQFKMAINFIEDDIKLLVSQWEDEQEIMSNLWGENYSEEVMEKLIQQEITPILEKRLEKILNG